MANVNAGSGRAITAVAERSSGGRHAGHSRVAEALVSSDDLRMTKPLVSNDVGAAPA
jgi:hypothetical protein